MRDNSFTRKTLVLETIYLLQLVFETSFTMFRFDNTLREGYNVRDFDVANFFSKCGASVKLVGHDRWFDPDEGHFMMLHEDKLIEAVDFNEKDVVSEAFKPLGTKT